jgi:hypothetical protein
LSKGSEALPNDSQVVWVERDVRNGKFACRIRHGGSRKAADRITNFDCCVWDHCTGRINNNASDLRRISRLTVNSEMVRKKEKDQENHSTPLQIGSQHRFLLTDGKQDSDKGRFSD